MLKIPKFTQIHNSLNVSMLVGNCLFQGVKGDEDENIYLYLGT